MIRGHLKYFVLRLLEKEPMTGYTLMNKIEKMIGNRPSPGSIYPMLDSMHTEKLLNMKIEGKKKIYSLSKNGEKKLQFFNKKKDKILEKLYEGLKIFQSICKNKEKKFYQELVDLMKSGKYPLNEAMIKFNPEITEFKKSLFPFLNIKDKKKINKVKKILRETTKKIKSIK
jgi:formylmethanofuran dehydrogenase subunit E